MNPLAALRTKAARKPQITRVLIVDDEPLYAEAISVLLGASEGIEVVGVAEDGQDGIDQAVELQPDLVLMDVQMPRLDGISATRRLRHRLPRTKVLVMTALTGDEYQEQAIQAGADAFVRKFSHSGDLLTTIEQLAASGALAA
jgi:DNA-binding NarL/FixJ family response regulator